MTRKTALVIAAIAAALGLSLGAAAVSAPAHAATQTYYRG